MLFRSEDNKQNSFKIDLKCFRGEKRKKSINDAYVIEEIVGRGNYGEVRRIKDKVTGKYKVIKKTLKVKCKMTDNFENEIEIIKRLVSYFKFRTTQTLFDSMNFIKMKLRIILSQSTLL